MILEFPDFDTLSLALTTGAVPEEVHAAAAVIGTRDDGSVVLETKATLPKAVRVDLRRLGVKGRRWWPKGLAKRNVDSWACAFPLVRRPIPDFDDRTPVLFELERGEQLPEIVNEMLRLGNDRQSFRHVVNGEGERVLLRVIGPPYYSLLRAFEGAGDDANAEAPPVAFVERAPRVWIEAGWDHPFGGRLTPPPGRVLLLSPPDEWRTLEEAPFRDVYEVLEFSLPESTADLADGEFEDRLAVPLRIVRGGPAEGGELWVLGERGVDQLDEFVRTSRDTLLDRLAFAVGERDGKRIVVLKTRPGRGAPPVVVLDGLACGPYLKLPNLFLPTGARLHPPLRRETVKELLAADENRIVWLRPEGGEAGRPESFTPFDIADTAFRPLTDWVDYVLDRAAEPLLEWMASTTFDFERFVCPQEQAERRKREKSESREREKSERREKKPRERAKRKRPTREAGDAETRSFTMTTEVEKPAERRALEERLRELERAFVASDVEADAPERIDSWREMARLNAALGHHGDAAICWTQTFWEEADPEPAALFEWYAAERSASIKGPEAADPLSVEEIDDLLTAPAPTPSRVQSLAAHLAFTVAKGERPEELVGRLAELQQFLDRMDGMLSVRAGWLAALALFQLTDGDVLAVARARDRLLERLFEHGLRPDRDLPGFLRGAGLRSGERFRAVKEHVFRIHETARDWAERNRGAVGATTTVHYVDLYFAFGFAKLGENDRAREMLEDVQVELHGTDDVHGWLVAAFAHRIEQAIATKPTSTSLPESLLSDLDAAFSVSDELREKLDPGSAKKLEDDLKLERYKVDRLRNSSRILEPHEKIDPYRRYNRGFRDGLEVELVELAECVDRAELIERVSGLLSRSGMNAADRARTLTAVLETGPRVGEALAEVALAEVPGLLPGIDGPVPRALLLERSLYVAAHFDRRDELVGFLNGLHTLLDEQKSADIETLKALHAVLAESFRGLRRMGMRDEIGRLLERLEAVVAGIALPAKRPRARNPAEWNNTVVETSRMQLQVAEGWFYFGRGERAWPIVESVRKHVFESEMMAAQRTPLVCAYVSTLGRSPVEEAVPRMLEVFTSLERLHDNFTTNTHYSVSQLNVIESAVLAMVGDDMVLDPGARRWLDEDEYLVRRRIHADVRAAMSGVD